MTAPKPRRTRGLLWALAGAALVVIVTGVALASRFGEDPGLIASPLIGKPAPDVVLPYLEDDGVLAMSDLRGEIVVLNFWASWCIPCRQEHPVLVETARRYESSEVTFVGALYRDEPGDAVDFLDELGRGYTYVVDEGSRAALRYGVFGVPETYFIDREGIVVGKIIGPVSPGILTASLDAIILGQPIDSIETGPVQSEP